ncbi:MAG: L,D-transpeptidase family protein [Planctomycetota bacterium]
MARHPYGPQARRRARNRTYTVLALIVVVILIAFMYGPFGADAEDESKPLESGYPAEPNTADSDPAVDVPDANENETFLVEEPEPAEPVTIGPEPNSVVPDPQPEIQPAIAEPNLPPVAFQPEPGLTVEPNPEADVLIAEAAALIDQGTSGHLEARGILNQALRMPLNVKQKEYVKAQLSELANRWLFSRTILPGDPLCETYRVRPGDVFETIGRKYKVPYEILKEINRIRNPRSLPAGQSIKVVNGPFHAKVYRSTFTMDVYLQNTYVRSYKVGLGKVDTETPTGLWRVKPGGKLVKPIWTDQFGKTHHPEDPNYPLGSRWIALEGLSGEAKDRTGFAIHGTKEPEQIGARGSMGCIRMHNGEAIMVYNMLADGLSQVEVTD